MHLGNITQPEQHRFCIRPVSSPYLSNINIPIIMSWIEMEMNLRRSGLPTLTRSAKPLLPPRLTESAGSLLIDLCYKTSDTLVTAQ